MQAWPTTRLGLDGAHVRRLEMAKRARTRSETRSGTRSETRSGTPSGSGSRSIHALSVGQVAERSGVAISALHFYEAKGLISSQRTGGNQRRYPRDVLRR